MTLGRPGVVPHPDEGVLATGHRRPSTCLTLANANCRGDTIGESGGEAVEVRGGWQRGRVGEVCALCFCLACLDVEW